MQGSQLPGAAASEPRTTEDFDLVITADPGWHGFTQSFKHGATLGTMLNYKEIAAPLISCSDTRALYKTRAQKRGPQTA